MNNKTDHLTAFLFLFRMNNLSYVKKGGNYHYSNDITCTNILYSVRPILNCWDAILIFKKISSLEFHRSVFRALPKSLEKLRTQNIQNISTIYPSHSLIHAQILNEFIPSPLKKKRKEKANSAPFGCMKGRRLLKTFFC